MNETVQLAKRHGVKVGAHPSLPGSSLPSAMSTMIPFSSSCLLSPDATLVTDRQGFGRREMKMTPQEFADCMTYQTGALYGFLKTHGMEMSHIKPHGSAYVCLSLR